MTSSPHARFPGPAGTEPGGRRTLRPGWPEIGVAAVAFAVLYVVTAVILRAIPDNAVAVSGLAGFALSAAIGLGPFSSAVLLRIRRVAAFGVRKASGKWLLIGAGTGLVCFVLSIGASLAYRVLSGDTSNVQEGYQSAAGSGTLMLLATLALGSVATPIGEEFLWRGVLTNALSRYGAWVAVLVSAAAFALAHGVNPVMPVAFVVGVANALLLRRTGSVWPGVFAHGVNNALSSLVPLLVAAATHG